jgi:hypothetical protein
MKAGDLTRRNRRYLCGLTHQRWLILFLLGLVPWTAMELMVRDEEYDVRDQSRG